MSTTSPSSLNNSLTSSSTHACSSFVPVREVRVVLESKEEAEEEREGKGIGIIDIPQISFDNYNNDMNKNNCYYHNQQYYYYSQLRERIIAQLDDLPQDFCFVVQGLRVTPRQENDKCVFIHNNINNINSNITPCIILREIKTIIADVNTTTSTATTTQQQQQQQQQQTIIDSILMGEEREEEYNKFITLGKKELKHPLKAFMSEHERSLHAQSEMSQLKNQLLEQTVQAEQFQTLQQEMQVFKLNEQRLQLTVKRRSKEQQDIYDTELKNLGVNVTSNQTELYLDTEQIGPLGIEAIAHSQRLTNLTLLNLYSTNIDDDGAKALANSTTLTNLTKLYLSDNNIGVDGVKALAESTTLTNLTLLYLYSNNVGDDGAKALANSTKLTNLKELYLSHNNIGVDGAKALANSTTLINLTKMDLYNNNIGDDGAKALVESTTLGNLKELYLQSNNIDPVFQQAIRNSKRSSLTLDL